MVYNLKSVHLPKLKGTGLRTMAALLSFGPTRALLAPSLLKNGGITGFRKLALEGHPLHTPIDYYASDVPAKQHDAIDSLKSFVKSREGKSMGQVRRLHDAYTSGKMTPKDVVFKVFEAVSADLKRLQPINAVIAMNKDEVISMAEASALRYVNQTPISVLDGVPIFIKDEMDVAGYETTVGTTFLSAGIAEHDSTLVKRLRDLGAIIMGKTNMHEIGINPTGYNHRFGLVRNPYLPSHDPGGSSSGSAAAVAMGLCPIAIGADGGGSIRIPAAFCGIAGLKATYGRISEHGVYPLCHSVGHVGPIAATAEDAAIAYLAMAGVDASDETTQHQGKMKPIKSIQDFSKIRVGVFQAWNTHASEDVVSATDSVVEYLEDKGAQIVSIEIPMLDEMRLAHSISILSEMSAAMQNNSDKFHQHGPSVQASLAIGQCLTSADYVRAQQVRRKAAVIFDEVFKDVDIILTPASAITAPEIPSGADDCGWSDLGTTIEAMRYVIPGNLLGLPAMSINIGLNTSGLPIGLQLMSNAWTEDLLLSLAMELADFETSVMPRSYLDLFS